MKKKASWSRNDKIGVAGLAIALIACASAFFIPEVRRFFGLEKPATVQAPAQVQTSAAPSAVAPWQTAPTPPKSQIKRTKRNRVSAPAATARTSGPNSPAVGRITQSAGSALSINQQGGITAGTINISSPQVIYSYDGSVKKTVSAGNVRMDVNNPNETVTKIRAEISTGWEQEALSGAQGLITSDPLWATPHILAGLAYVNIGNQEAAKSELQKARSLVPTGSEYEQEYTLHLQHLDEAITRHEPKP